MSDDSRRIVKDIDAENSTSTARNGLSPILRSLSIALCIRLASPAPKLVHFEIADEMMRRMVWFKSLRGPKCLFLGIYIIFNENQKSVVGTNILVKLLGQMCMVELVAS